MLTQTKSLSTAEKQLIYEEPLGPLERVWVRMAGSTWPPTTWRGR